MRLRNGLAAMGIEPFFSIPNVQVKEYGHARFDAGEFEMGRIRLGYACVNLSLGRRGLTSRTCRLRNATRSRLEALARANLDGLSEVLRWNASQKIRFFRISSGVIPLASHPEAQWPWRKVLAQELADAGRLVKRKNMRVSMHPGQYAVLNSPRGSVVRAAKAELSYHADFLDHLNLDSEHKIVLHVGGLYGNRDASMRRFSTEFARLPGNVRSRLVLENDERSYGAEDVLFLSEALGLPMVFDYLHQIAFSGDIPNKNLVVGACKSWSASDGRPEFHYSTQNPNSRKGAHADMIDVQDFLRFLQVLPFTDVDVMLEAKAKDLALLSLRSKLRTRLNGFKGWSIT